MKFITADSVRRIRRIAVLVGHVLRVVLTTGYEIEDVARTLPNQ